MVFDCFVVLYINKGDRIKAHSEIHSQVPKQGKQWMGGRTCFVRHPMWFHCCVVKVAEGFGPKAHVTLFTEAFYKLDEGRIEGNSCGKLGNLWGVRGISRKIILLKSVESELELLHRDLPSTVLQFFLKTKQSITLNQTDWCGHLKSLRVHHGGTKKWKRTAVTTQTQNNIPAEKHFCHAARRDSWNVFPPKCRNY